MFIFLLPFDMTDQRTVNRDGKSETKPGLFIDHVARLDWLLLSNVAIGYKVSYGKVSELIFIHAVQSEQLTKPAAIITRLMLLFLTRSPTDTRHTLSSAENQICVHL